MPRLVAHDTFEGTVTAEDIGRAWDAFLPAGSAASVIGVKTASGGAYGFGRYLDATISSSVRSYAFFSLGDVLTDVEVQFDLWVNPSSAGNTRRIVCFSRTDLTQNDSHLKQRLAQFGIQYNGTTRVLELIDGAGTVLASGTTRVDDDAWHTIQIKAFVTGTSFLMKLDANDEISYSGNLANGGSGFDWISFWNYICVDNFGVWDWTGETLPAADTWLEIHVSEGHQPIADEPGECSCTPSSGTDRYAMVDDVPRHDSDATYNSGVPGNADLFQVQAVSAPYGIASVVLLAYCRKDNPDTRVVALRVKEDGTITNGSNIFLSPSYTLYTRWMELAPSGNAWTQMRFNASRFGYTVIS